MQEKGEKIMKRRKKNRGRRRNKELGKEVKNGERGE